MRILSRMFEYDYPDPDVIKVEEWYYLASTTMYFFPGGAILRSKDLLNWEICGYLFDTLDDTPAERLEGGENIYGKGMWAPSLRFHDGKFYVAFVSHGQKDTHLFVADKPEGPWERRKIEGYYHDCSLLFDNGKTYIVYGNTEIKITELKRDLTGPMPGGLNRVIVRDNSENVILGYEGSHIYKIDNKYVLTLIHWPKEKVRTQAVFISDSLDGEFKGKDVLSDDGGFYNQGIAQGGLIEVSAGNWYAILFQDSGAVGRIPVIVPVKWEDGFPVFGIDNKAPSEFDSALVDDENWMFAIRNPLESDDYKNFHNNEKIDYSWQWNHVPDNNLWKIDYLNKLIIKTDRIVPNPMWAKNTLTKRLNFYGNEIRVLTDASNLKVGDTAGILILNSFYKMFGIRREKDGYYLVVLEGSPSNNKTKIGFDDKEEPITLYKELINEKSAVLKALVTFDELEGKVQFYHDKDRKICEQMSFSFDLNLFTGARVGLCVYSSENIGGEASFGAFYNEILYDSDEEYDIEFIENKETILDSIWEKEVEIQSKGTSHRYNPYDYSDTKKNLVFIIIIAIIVTFFSIGEIISNIDYGVEFDIVPISALVITWSMVLGWIVYLIIKSRKN